jgi:hypothetical protein
VTLSSAGVRATGESWAGNDNGLSCRHNTRSANMTCNRKVHIDGMVGFRLDVKLAGVHHLEVAVNDQLQPEGWNRPGYTPGQDSRLRQERDMPA